MTLDELMIEFMKKHRQFKSNVPAIPPADVVILRMRLMAEELGETFTAMHQRDLVLIADGLADLAYVVIGTAMAYGIPFDEVFREVHRSNMTKAPLDINDKGGKVGKAGYEPPDLAGILWKDVPARPGVDG